MRDGTLKSGEQLPADVVIAGRFGVNRHTVRQATAYLESGGPAADQRGRGTFVADDVLQYRLGRTTRFTENLLRQRREPARTVLGIEELPAPAAIAEALKVEVDAPLILLTLLGEADGAPLSLGRNYFPASRLAGIADEFRRRAAAKERFSIHRLPRRRRHRQLSSQAHAGRSATAGRRRSAAARDGENAAGDRNGKSRRDRQRHAGDLRAHLFRAGSPAVRGRVVAMAMVLAGASVVLRDRVVRADLHLDEGLIVGIGEAPPGIARLDCADCLILPGFVDLHTDNVERHVEPGPACSGRPTTRCSRMMRSWRALASPRRSMRSRWAAGFPGRRGRRSRLASFALSIAPAMRGCFASIIACTCAAS